MRYKIPIPVFYVSLTEGSRDRGRLFKQYVRSYIKMNHPDMELKKIEGLNAICERRE